MTFSGRQIAAVRSFLFVPLSNEKLIRKAGSSSADAIILDLEDAVSISEKTVARENLKKHASLIEDAGKFVVVRINAESEMAPLDVEALVHVRPDAVMVPKFESVEQIADTIGMLRSKGSGRQVGIIGLIETPLGLCRLNTIAQAEGLIGIALGSEDFAACMGVPPTPLLLDMPCRQIAMTAAAFDLAGICQPFSIARFEDAEGSEEAARLARAYGASGLLCIHPRQVEIANTAFVPTREQVEWARKIVSKWSDHPEGGIGIMKQDGAMVDVPVVKLARKIINRAR